MKTNLQFSIRWKFDKKSKSWVVYNSKYNFSGYGKTKKEALEMFKETIYDTLDTKPF